MTTGLGDLTGDQRNALDAITAWYRSGGQPPLTLGGLAGTGKTTLAGLLPQVLPGVRTAFCAYTGQAASVLSRKLGGPVAASTIHRMLYEPAGSIACAASGLPPLRPGGNCPLHQRSAIRCRMREHVRFMPKLRPLAGLGLVVADEASMISETVWADLTGHGVPVLAIGDHGQLPPVMSSFNLMAAPQLLLEQIHRQGRASPIVQLAMMAREQGSIPHGVYYGPSGDSAVKMTREQAGAEMIQPDSEAGDLMICARNGTRVQANTVYRWARGRTGPPQAGDIVICLRNDWEQGLINGERGLVLGTGGGPLAADGQGLIPVSVQFGRDRVWDGLALADQFGSEEKLAAPRRLRLGGQKAPVALLDYGYAMTCHKAQGSQASRVLVVEEHLPGTDYRRWLYTAVTRAEHELVVIG